eukprot:SAG31_NODE_4756_length_2975_cov_2.249652_5_plen_66_part_01
MRLQLRLAQRAVPAPKGHGLRCGGHASLEDSQGYRPTSALYTFSFACLFILANGDARAGLEAFKDA